MSSKPLRRLLASTGFRLAVINAVLLVAAFAVAGVGAWLATLGAASSALRPQIEKETQLLTMTLETQGVVATQNAIAIRYGKPSTLIYRLSDSDGQLLAGSAALPVLDSGWRIVDPPDVGPQPLGDFLVKTSILDGRMRLSVGDDLERSELIRDAVLRSLALTGLLSVAAALFLGVVVTRRTLARVDRLSAVVEKVAEGDLSVRVSEPRGKSADDLNTLTLTFNTMLGRIEHLVTSIRRVTANVAHDLRTPLAHLDQKIQAVRKAEDLPSAEVILCEMEEDIKRLLRTFEAMLRLSEIESGVIRSQFSRMDVAEVIGGVIDAYRPDIESNGRQLAVELAAGSFIFGEPVLISQMIANLLDNALHHAPSGSNISVSLALSDVRTRRVRSELLIRIADAGPGISANRRRQLLDPFERGDESRNSPGSGLGLSIVRAIVELHGGQIELQDNDPGLAVLIQLPTAA